MFNQHRNSKKVAHQQPQKTAADADCQPKSSAQNARSGYFNKLLGGEAAQERLIRKARFFPAKCAAWASLVLVSQAVVNVTLLHRDPGFADSFQVELPNHYAIAFIDVTDHGVVYNSRTQSEPSLLFSDSVADVRLLQLHGNFLVGGVDSQVDAHFGQPGMPVDKFFAINTQSNLRANFATREPLRQWTTAHGFELELEPIANFYQRDRSTWFDGLALALVLLGPAVGFYRLTHAVFRARRSVQPASVTPG